MLAQDAALCGSAQASRRGICFVYDLRGVGLRNLVFDPFVLRDLLRGATNHPSHISRVWLVDAPRVFLAAWRVGKVFVPEFVRRGVRFGTRGADGGLEETCAERARSRGAFETEPSKQPNSYVRTKPKMTKITLSLDMTQSESPVHALHEEICARSELPPYLGGDAEKRTSGKISFQNTIRAWRALSAEGLQGKGWCKRSVFFTDTGRDPFGRASGDAGRFGRPFADVMFERLEGQALAYR